jgi:hypothetical protein
MEWSKNNLTECLKTEGLHMDVSKWNFTFWLNLIIEN